MTRFERLASFYQAAALLLLNTLVLFALLNLIVYPFLLLFDSRDAGVVSKYGMERLKSVYPGMEAGEITALLEETWSRPYVYEPFTQFKERPFQGRFVNVDENGFRVTPDQGPWPPSSDSLNIFVFGGSTTFGYGVSDDETVPAVIERDLRLEIGDRINVYNFGRGHYYSTQERVLFFQLIAAGHRPDLVIFIDGLNDFFFHTDEPAYTPRLREFVAGEHESPWRISQLPLSRVFTAARKWIRNFRSVPPVNDFNDLDIIDRVVGRYFSNMDMINAVAQAHGINTAFVWQPAPTFGPGGDQSRFNGFDYGRHEYSRFGYARMEKIVSANDPGPGFLWCADLAGTPEEASYVDLVHYSADYSERLGSYIVGLLLERGLVLPRAG